MINAYDFCDCLVRGQTITKLLASNKLINVMHTQTRFLNRFFDWGHLLIYLFHTRLPLPAFKNINEPLLWQIRSELENQKVLIISAGYKEVIYEFFKARGMETSNLIIIANTFSSPKRIIKGSTKVNFMKKYSIDKFYTDSYEDISCQEQCCELIQVTDFYNDLRFSK